MKNNISNIFSIISNNVSISYAQDTFNNYSIINEVSEIYPTLPLEVVIEYGVRSSYCLFFDPMNQKTQIALSQSYNIEPIIVLNTIPQQLQKKEDFYLFNQEHKHLKKITFYNYILNTFNDPSITLIDRPQIPKADIQKRINKSKYDALIFCNNQHLSQSILNDIKSKNPNYSINYLDSYKNIISLESLYQQISEYGLLIAINDPLLANIALDLNIKTISNLRLEGTNLCQTNSDIIEAIKNTDHQPIELIEYNFQKNFKTYIDNLT